MNRMVDLRSAEWSHWVLLLTTGGFFGNFVLSLTDHATNGFFSSAEWIPVGSTGWTRDAGWGYRTCWYTIFQKYSSVQLGETSPRQVATLGVRKRDHKF